jgi:hypothetical protein
MTKSGASSVPAVPPPPVAGAAVTGLAVGFDVAGVVGFAVTVSVVTPVFGEVGADENEVSAAPGVEVEDAEQAETAAETKMVMVPHPRTLNIALSPAPAMVVRTFMEPLLRRPAGGGPLPGSGTRKPAPEGNTRGDPVAARAGWRQVPESAGGHEGKAHRRHRHTMT